MDIAQMIEVDLSDVQCAYFRETTDQEGDAEYCLFDQDGDLILCSDSRSAVFFFAAEYEIPLVRLQ